jgi:5-methylcytosine-specific restriction endonuclease McrA
MLIDAGRVRKRDYRPFTIHLKDRAADDGNTAVQPVEVRCTPGARRSGIAVVATLDHEDRVLYQEEIEHRADISQRLHERRAHRHRRRSGKWYRAPRFDNRTGYAGRLPPSIESVVSNQEHRIRRLAARSGAGTAVVQTAKFDTHRILNPQVQGTGYQHGPLYRRHLREYIAAQWSHRCAYCGKGDWEDRTAFNLDHVVPRSRGGADNIRNLVWSCRPCNEQKGEQPVDGFLRENPERLTAVLRRRQHPLAAAGQHAAICKALLHRLNASGLKTAETTGADTAHTREANGIAKSHADDAACCKAREPVRQLRRPLKLKSIGHGRRKQIKSLPVGPYLSWRHQKPAERRAAPCPGHAHHPNHVHGIRTGDMVRILTKTGWRNGRAGVEAGRGVVRVRTTNGAFTTTKTARVRKVARRNGYQTTQT